MTETQPRSSEHHLIAMWLSEVARRAIEHREQLNRVSDPLERHCLSLFSVSLQHRKKTTPKDAHNQAVEHHENAAKAHRTNAEHHGKGDHATGKQHADKAKQHSQGPHEPSEKAHGKSQQQK